jgi:hypothetical protein
MPITISIGWNQEFNAPDFGSLEATCDVRLEVDPHLLEADLEGFQQRVKNALVICRQAVENELASQSSSGPDADAGTAAAAEITPKPAHAESNGSNASRSPACRNGDSYSGTLSTWL